MFKIFLGNGFFPDFTKSIHYVSWTPRAGYLGGYKQSGYSSLAWPFAVTCHALNIPEEGAITLFREIDRRSETATFCPEANVTLMPNLRSYNDEEIFKHFNDAMMCQNTLIKVRNVIFDMRNYTYHFPDSGIASNREYVYMIKSEYSRHMDSCPDDEVNYFVIACDIGEIFDGFTYKYRPLTFGYFGFDEKLKDLCLPGCM